MCIAQGVFAVCVEASGIQPFNIVNTYPSILVHNRPAPGTATVNRPGDFDTGLVYEVASHFNQEQNSDELIIFDGETTRLELSFRYGVWEGVDFELKVPYYQHEPGTLDGFIDDWHEFFGLPENDRDKAPTDRLLYLYRYKGETLLYLDKPTSGLGDVRIIVTRQLVNHGFDNINNLALKTAIKFPTGEADKLTGSGAASVSVWAAADMATSWFELPGLTYGSIGMMYLQEGDVIPQQQNHLVAFGGAGSGFILNDHVALQVQLDISSPYYSDSEYADITGFTMQLAMGGNIQFGKNWSLQLGVIEDLRVHSSPDVIFHMELKSHY